MLNKLLSRFRPKTANDNTVLVLDIGTEFVKAMIFQIEENHGFITGYARIQQKLGDMHAGAISNIAGVTYNCEEAIQTAAKMAGYQPEQVVMGIAGELVRGETTTISYTRESPEVRIDLPELRAIVQKVQTKAFEQVRREMARDTGHREIDVKLVNASVIDSRIDGQHVSNPLGFQGKEVTLSIFNSFAPLLHFGALQTIAAELELDLLSIATEPYAVSRVLETDSANNFAAIFIDVGGGTTDIALVRGGELTTKMFPLGGRTFTKRLAQTLNIGMQEAERLKLEYSQNKLTSKRGAVQKAIEADTEVWLTGVQLGLSEMAGEKPLPAKILLCGGGSRLPEIKHALESAEWIKNLPFRNRPSVKFIVPDDVPNFTDQTKLVRTVQDITPLALANLGRQMAGEEKLFSLILRKTIKLLQNGFAVNAKIQTS
ncbi:MAG: cell division FtsA domain-containing protein, partial [Candidatus Gracilibacteria bacterium]|nr:cell division FtsA domain-containing protein [Candidatus Gracilibacteria bacterium]